jgi:hypothetical protein
MLKSVENAVPSEISAWCEMLLIAVFCVGCDQPMCIMWVR